MKKAKNLGGKLTAVLLSIAMICSTILPGTVAHAAEVGIEAGGDAATPLTDSVNKPVSETNSGNEVLDEAGSGDEATDESASENEESDENISGDEVPGGDVSDDEDSDESASDSDIQDGETGEGIGGETGEGTEVEAEDTFPEETEDITELGESVEILSEQLSTVSVSEFSNVGGWNESIYAEIAGVKDADVTEVSYSGPTSGKLSGDDFTYLVRDIANGKNESTGEGVRIDIPGLKAGTYTLTVKVGSSTLTKSGITVTSYDRSGYAHFNYTSGVGAYNDDGTLKKNAIVVYVTDDNKNTVKIPYNNDKTAGIGNIFSSSSNIVRTLAQNNIPLVVRFVGTVSETGLYERGAYDTRDGVRLIKGLSAYETHLDDNNEPDGDNGHMTYIHSFKDLTLEGIGYDATIDGWGFQAVAKSDYPKLGKSFEVRNLTFINTPEDAVGMEGQQSGSTITVGIERCWIHNISCYCPNILHPAAKDKAEGDGSVDFKKGQYLTSSYNFFEGSHKTHLVGGGNSHLQYNITYHHNHWYMCNSRGPLSRNANIHMYNNFVDMQRDYAQNVRANAYIFSEYNLFYASRGAQNVDTNTGGVIKSYNDSFSSVIWNYTKGTIVTNKSEYVPNSCQYAAESIKYDKFDTDASLSYIPGNNYKLQTDFTELRKVIASQTGVQKRESKSITDVTESDYSVIERSGVTVNEIASLPKTLSSVKTTSKGYAFKVSKPFDLNIEYSDSSKPGILINAAGENLLEGNGSVKSLLPGTYMIQSADFTKAEYSTEKGEGTPSVFKDITIRSLEITGGSDVIAYTIYFDHNDGSEVESVTIYSNQKYEITKVPTRDGYDFAGWYDAKEGGNLVSSIDGSKLTGDITLYAHWNKQGIAYTLSLDCDTDLDQFVVGTADSDDKGWNITATTEPINGFIIHAASGSKTENSKTTKYYMTVKNVSPKTLATNGVLITDKTISGNEDGLLKSIEFTTKGSGVLTAEMALSGSTESGKKYNIVLSRKSSDGSLETVKSHSITNGTTKTTFKFEFDKADTYYLYPEGDKGVVYYSLNVQGVEDEEEKQPEVQPKYYTVTLDTDGGTLADGGKTVRSIKENDTIDPGKCTKEGYTFKEWTVDGKTVTMPYTVTKDVTLKAVYTKDEEKQPEEQPKYYTVTLDTDEGTLVDGGETVRSIKENDKINPGECVKEGYTFKEWTVDGEAVTMPYTVTKDVTLKATYTKNGSQDGDDSQGGDNGSTDSDSQKGIKIKGLEGPFYYTGSKIIPDIEVWDYDIEAEEEQNTDEKDVDEDETKAEKGRLLTPGVDYTVKYSNNVKSSSDPTNKEKKAKVIVTGKGNYIGRDAEATFEIKDADNFTGDPADLLDLKGAKISKIDPVTYRGTAWYPAFTLTLKGGVSTDYFYSYEKGVYETKAEGAIKANVALSNNTNKGTATLLLTGAPDGKGKATTVKKTFKINAMDISNAVLIKNEQTNPYGAYAVKGAIPDEDSVELKVTLGFNENTWEQPLKEGIDYTVKYTNNKKAGTANIVFSGKGNYTKKKTDTFTVTKLDMSKLPIAVSAYDGVKTNKIKTTVLDSQGNALKASQYNINVYQEDGTTTYSSPKLMLGDTIVVEAEAKDTTNLDGKTTKIKIKVGANIGKAKFKLKKVSGKTLTKTYTGAEIELNKDDLEVTMKGASGEITYEIVGYTNNINKGTATAYIQGTGEYSGTNKVKFKIVSKKMDISN